MFFTISQINNYLYRFLLLYIIIQIKSIFEYGNKIPVKYTADGANVNPPLEISNIPKGTKSIIIIVDDSDAQRVVGYTWVHWIKYNIPVYENDLKIEEDLLPGISGLSTYKYEKYGRPNPPRGSGIHHYYFKVYALNSNFNVEDNIDKENFENLMKGKITEKAELVGIYYRE